jgi:stage II sporulation protein E
MMDKWGMWRVDRSSTRQWSSEVWGKVRERLMENRLVQGFVARRWSFVIVLMGFLLGRAVILEQFMPFAPAFFAVIYFFRKDMLYGTTLAITLGSMTAAHGGTAVLLAQMLVFYWNQKGLEKFEKTDLAYIPLTVFFTVFTVRLFSYMVAGDLSWYAVGITAVEGVLGFVLSLIFMQAIPVFTLTRKNYQLKTEEIICLMILLASVMTGMVGWTYYDASAENVLSRFLILLFAFVGGAAMGASVGVITGLILSLANVEAIYQISVLAFSGLLAGLLKEGKKTGVALGLLLGSILLSLYVGDRTQIIASIWESVTAVLLFMLLPKRFIGTVAKYVPGTQEHARSQLDYARRMRDIVSGRIEQFSEVFRQLASSFAFLGGTEDQKDQKEEHIAHFMDEVASKTCSTCWKKDKCWEARFYDTYKYMTEMMSAIEENPNMLKADIRREWKQVCAKTEAVLETMKQQYVLYKHNQHWKQQIQESRLLVADQLKGVSRVMQDLSREIKREGQEMFLQEEQIRHALETLGLPIYGIDIISLEEGNVQIEMVHRYGKGMDESRKLIAPLLTDILGENIAVKRETTGADGYTTVEFGSAKEFEVETGVAGAAKGGELLSGDSYSTLELSNGKFAVALSDGMGNGERASQESRTALTILQQLLQSGMDEKLAIKSVNSILLLRSPDEVFATIDLALVDLYSAKTTFLKVGSTPSFIKRGKEVITVKANNLPVGILSDIEFDLLDMQLKPGDTLIMMTDGVYDAPGHAVNKELWMKRVIQELKTEDPQEIADCLLETVVRYQHGEIADDMTVVVARINSYQPEWAAIRWPGLSHLERPKTVS